MSRRLSGFCESTNNNKFLICDFINSKNLLLQKIIPLKSQFPEGISVISIHQASQTFGPGKAPDMNIPVDAPKPKIHSSVTINFFEEKELNDLDGIKAQLSHPVIGSLV
jgi:hypothetical protein